MSKIFAFAHSAGLWLAILAGLVLPALFSIGYRPLDLEIFQIVTLSALLAIATASAFQTLPQSSEYMMAAAVVALGIHIYYLPTIGPLGFAVMVASVVVLAYVLGQSFMFAAAMASLAAIIFAALNGPSFLQKELPFVAATNEKQPAVVHLLMDEFTAPEGMPRDVLPSKEIKKIVDSYVGRGFQIFTRAFSLHGMTGISIAQLSNTSSSSPAKLVKVLANGHARELTSAETFAMIAKRWQIRAIMPYVDITPALLQAPKPVSGFVYNSGIPNPTVKQFGLMATDRFRIVGAILHNWVYSRQRANFYRWLIGRGPSILGRSVQRFAYAKGDLWPLGSMVVLEQIIANEIPHLKRGQYLFAHLILPHFPYVFTRNCQLRPLSQWRNSTILPGRKFTPKYRAERYRLYFEQVMCVQRKLDDLFVAIARNPELHDAVVIVHGDHGSRIPFKRWESLAGKGFDEAAYLRDWHATFFAVRLPRKQGRQISEPLAIHDLFAELVRKGFSDLDVGAIKRRPLSYRMFP